MVRILITLTLFISLVTLHAQPPNSNYCIQGRFAQIPYFAATEIVAIKNVTYGWAPRWPASTVDTLRMDVYMPDPAIDPLAVRPFVLLIHGGAFLGGKKEDMELACRDYARRGFVAASISYRLGWDCNPSNPFLICSDCGSQANKLRVAAYRSVQDALAALRFSAFHATDYGIDTSFFFVGGTSAGSVAAIHALYLDQETANTFCPDCVQEVGLLDEAVNTIQATYNIRGLLNNCGAIIQPDALNNAPEVPVISFHDEGDCVVPSDLGWALGCLNCTAFFQGYGSQQIHAFAETQGTCTELNLRLGSPNHCSFPAATVTNRSSCFMKKIFCGSCTNNENNDINAIESCDQLGTVALEDGISGQYGFRVYPNPSNGQYFLDVFSPLVDGKTFIQIADQRGQVVLSLDQISANTQELDLSPLPSGVYVVRLLGSERPYVQKIQLVK